MPSHPGVASSRPSFKPSYHSLSSERRYQSTPDGLTGSGAVEMQHEAIRQAEFGEEQVQVDAAASKV